MKANLKKPFIYVLSGMGLTALLVLFIRWQTETAARPLPQKIVATVSVLLFALVGLLAVRQWAEFWSSEPDETPALPLSFTRDSMVNAVVMSEILNRKSRRPGIR